MGGGSLGGLAGGGALFDAALGVLDVGLEVVEPLANGRGDVVAGPGVVELIGEPAALRADLEPKLRLEQPVAHLLEDDRPEGLRPLES